MGCRFPVMQASIGRVGDARLAAAVTQAGGLGSLCASYMDPADLREQIRLIHRATDRPFAVNLILAFDQAERLETALEEHVSWVSFSWGLNAELIARARAGAAQVLVQVASASEARDAVGAGADALIVQGVEAGGHVQSTQALLQLLAEVRAGVSVPIVAAGGIAEPETARVAIAAGADVVSMGTRFAACEESLAHARYQARLVDATGNDTVLTDLFDIGWAAPHRVLRNQTYETWVAAGRPRSGKRPGETEPIATGPAGHIARYSMQPALAGMTGDIDQMSLYAGLGVGFITSIEPAEAIVARFAAALAE